MIVPNRRLIETLYPKLQPLLAHAAGFGSDEQAVLAALALLENRTTKGVALQRDYLAGLRGEIGRLAHDLDPAPSTLATLRDDVESAEASEELDDLEAHVLALAGRFGAVAAEVVGDTALDPDLRADIAVRIARWDAGQIAAAGRRDDTGGAVSTTITAGLLQTYLRDRFDDPTIAVTAFRRLPGGYGKETTLFAVSGNAVDGEFVMRRDHVRPIVDNECHRIDREFRVLRAVHAHGFPAPEAVWLDTEHRLLPGGHFIVMRRAPGVAGGDVFGADARLSDEQIDVLARALAHLHGLPALDELGDLTETINGEMWSLSLHDAIRRHVTTFRDMYVADMRDPSPAVLALYAWVIERIPAPLGRPVLLHGDVGFHNMLVDDGRLSALLDWEHAHVGDPAEDLGYLRNMLDGEAWARLIATYRAAGGCDVSAERLHFFRVWGQLRNATASSLSLNTFIRGGVDELKYAATGFFHLPVFINAAADLIAAGPED